MRKLFLAIWGINTVALVWLFGAILLYGSTPHRKEMAGDLAEIWAGLAAVYVWALFTAKQRPSKKKKRPLRDDNSELEDAIGRMSEQVWGYFNYRGKEK